MNALIRPFGVGVAAAALAAENIEAIASTYVGLAVSKAAVILGEESRE